MNGPQNSAYVGINSLTGKLVADDGVGHIEIELTMYQLLTLAADAAKAARHMIEEETHSA